MSILISSNMNRAEFEARVRYKLRGWYSRKEYENMAVERISKLRDEFHSLLADVNRPGMADLLDYLDECGFYYRPSSDIRHHNYPGGLAEHCLGVYRKMSEENIKGISEDSIKIVGLFHDLCKCDMFFFVGRSIHKHKRDGHGRRSVRILKRYGVTLSPEEYRAIRYHMGSSRNAERLKDPGFAKAVTEPLRKAVSEADHHDAAEACARARRK
jgi:hypothetical protein